MVFESCKDGLVLLAVHYTGENFSTSFISTNWMCGIGIDCTILKPCEVVSDGIHTHLLGR